jgi:hypothetical protein
MSLAFSFADAEKKIGEIEVDKYVRYLMVEHKQSMQKLSVLMGKEEGFIKKQIKRKHISLPLLYALTIHLKVNMFEPFINLLPDNLRATQRETALQNEIAALQQQLADVSKERDLLEKIVMK